FCQLKTEKEKSEASYYAQNDVIMMGCGELYCANNPIIYTDPDGEFFFALIGAAINWAASNTIIVAAAQAGAASAAISGGIAAATGGDIGQAMLNGFASGALSGGMANWIGHGSGLTGLGKTLAHGASGGIQSMAAGGDFGSGFLGGAVGDIAGNWANSFEANDISKIGAVGFASGVTSWASGGDFGQGFITGAGIEAFNHLDIGQMIEKGVDEKLEKMHSDPGST
ncbi:MAG: hypothetical protein GY710_24985, partial [Desulfobacteraceae bacterium]|nr:hypothetical protein [Desulfobacteraceae bacterium]